MLRAATASDGRLTAVLHGEIFDADAERRRLEAAGLPVEGDSSAALLLAGWRLEGPAFLARLHGEFAAAIWDADQRALHVVTDRFGLRPVYVAQPRGAFVAASEIKAVLAIPGVDTSWSEEGVAEFFGFGHFLGASTLFKGVRAVPPATVGTYQRRGRDL